MSYIYLFLDNRKFELLPLGHGTQLTFTFVELKTATKNFPPDSVLGEGGFGRVYKGWVDEKTMAPIRNNTGMTVVVKKLNSKSMQGYEQWQVTKILPFFSFIYSTY